MHFLSDTASITLHTVARLQLTYINSPPSSMLMGGNVQRQEGVENFRSLRQ